jgi:hypothetical protein
MIKRIVREKPVTTTLLTAVVLISLYVFVTWMLQRANSVHAAFREQAMTETSGFYCNLKALSVKERARHMQLTYKIERARVETVELANGFAFRFQDSTVSLADLAEWVSGERKCCPFFDFEIELQGNNGPLWLKLRGQDGVKAFMRSEFGIR